ADVVLTLDATIQHAAEQAVQEAMVEHKARSASAVVIDVQQNEILALALAPHFNPNRATSVSSSVRRHRIFTDMFEPGSTIKPLVMAAALEAGIVKTNDIFFCENGRWGTGGHHIRDSSPHGWLSPLGVIQKSS